MTVTVLDYGRSNLLSVRRALEHCGAQVLFARTPQQAAAAQRLVLPGVGAFKDGMQALASRGLVAPLLEQARRGTPVLAICLGMQMLFSESDEGGRCAGLGLVPGRVQRLPALDASGAPQRVPHIGWYALTPCAVPLAGTVLADVPAGGQVYFVHSYEAKPAQPLSRLADTEYGGRRVCAAVQCGCVTGVQFHPEKSGEAGLSILRRFLAQPAAQT